MHTHYHTHTNLNHTPFPPPLHLISLFSFFSPGWVDRMSRHIRDVHFQRDPAAPQVSCYGALPHNAIIPAVVRVSHYFDTA